MLICHFHTAGQPYLRIRTQNARAPVGIMSALLHIAKVLFIALVCMQAQTADAKADCTEQAVLRIRSTLEWIKARRFMTPTQMHKWDHLVCQHSLDQSRILPFIVDNTDIFCFAPPIPPTVLMFLLSISQHGG